MLNYSQWQIWTFCHTITFQISSLKQAVKKYGDSSLALACCFLKAGTTLAFFHSQGNFPFSEHGWKIIFQSLKIDWSQIFNIRILIILWQWALLWVKISIFFKISYVENSSDESDLPVFLVRAKGNLLLLLAREHCFVKKSLKNPVFSLKSMINLQLYNRGEMQGICLLFRKVLNIDQYKFGLVLLSNSLSDRCESYFSLDSSVVAFKFA